MQAESHEAAAAAENGNLNPFPNSGNELTDPREQQTSETMPNASEPSMDWQRELYDRMEEFRRRRARISNSEADDKKNLSLDFYSAAPDPENQENPPGVIEFPAADGMDLPEDSSPALNSDWDSLALEELPEEAETSDMASPDAGPILAEPPMASDPMEIELDSSPASADFMGASGNASAFAIAPMSKRFMAGVFDLLGLLSGAGVFALVFWRAGGQFPLLPLNLTVAALIGVVFLMAYFGVFTVFAYGTPGLIWAGLEVRTFEGNPPRRIDCFWRAFGYLVSTSALLLGFIWAVVDGEGLTWHDRMSRTLLIDARKDEAFQPTASFSS